MSFHRNKGDGVATGMLGLDGRKATGVITGHLMKRNRDGGNDKRAISGALELKLSDGERLRGDRGR